MGQATDNSPINPDELSQLLEGAGLFLAVELRNGGLMISGEVESDADHRAALDIARGFAESRGLIIDDNIEVIEQVPDDAFGGGTTEEDDTILQEGLEALDIERSPGTVDAQESAEEAIPYFPPTDPVGERLYSGESLTDVSLFDTEPPASSGEGPGDEEISTRVRLALRDDASTTDFDIEVETRSGVVFLRGAVETLDDAENVEAVASRVTGVKDVREEMEVVSLMHPPDD